MMCFTSLVHRISPTLKKITKRLDGHFSYFSDEDLYQEALIHLWMDHKAGLLGDKTDSYILQGCYFHLRNYLRKVQDHAILVSISAPAGEGGVSLEEWVFSDDRVSFDELESNLHLEAMEQKYFTGREKQVLMLFLEGMTTREIGSKLGVSHVMILKIKNRIREKYGRFARQMEN